MSWIVVYLKEAQKDLDDLDRSQQLLVLKAIRKVSLHPLPQSEGGYGKPLGRRGSSNLTGFYKIKLLALGLRVVYCLVREKEVMRIIVISVRDDDAVYQIATERVEK